MGQWGCGITAHGVGIKIKERRLSTPFAMPQFGEVFFFERNDRIPNGYTTGQFRTRTADCRLRTGYTIRTRYKTRTADLV